jgi:two-component system OmpR family response regulator
MTTTLDKNSQRILVVDDEASISELISTSLRFVGFDVRTAANGAEALRVAEDFKPHAMVLDVMLPDQMVLKCARRFVMKVLIQEFCF